MDAESAIGYVRVSDPHDDGSGLANQRESVLRGAAERGYTVIDVIEEKQTGTVYRERAGLQAALAALKEGRATVLLIDRLDRISRRQAHIYIIDEACRDAGGRLESVLDEFEDSPEGRLLFSVKAFIAEIDRERILMRTVAGRKARVEKRKQLIPGIRPLYGYQWRDAERGAYEIDPITAPVVRRIYAAILAGQSMLSIADDLTTDGVPTPTGNARWRQSTIQYIATHPHYGGDAWAWAWRPQNGAKKNARFDPANGILLPDGTVPPIVERETWASVQRVIVANRNRKRADGVHAESALLRGRAVCAHCGHALYVSPRRGKLVYRCESRYRFGSGCTVHGVDVAVLDADAWAYVAAAVAQPEPFLRGREAASRRVDRSHDIAAIERALTRLERQQTTLTRRIANEPDDLIAGPLLAELRTIASRIRAAEEQRAALRDADAASAIQEQAAVDLAAWFTSLAGHLDSLSFARRRQTIELLGLTARVSRRGHDPQWTFEMRPLA